MAGDRVEPHLAGHERQEPAARLLDEALLLPGQQVHVQRRAPRLGLGEEPVEVEPRESRREHRHLADVELGERRGSAAAAREERVALLLVGDRDGDLVGARVGDEPGVQRAEALRQQADRHLPLQELRVAGPAPQRHDGVAVLDRQLAGVARGRERLAVIEDHRRREARVLAELGVEIRLDELQRAVGIAGLHLREVGAADLVVGPQHGLEIVARGGVGEADPRAAVVGDDHGAVGEHHLSEEVADRAVPLGAQRVQVPHAGPVEDEAIDAPLAHAALQRLRPGGE